MSTTQPIRNLEKLENFKNYYCTVKPNPRNRTLIVLGLNTALRISDVLHLTWGNVYNFQQKKVLAHITVQEQKTGKINCVCLNPNVQEALSAYMHLANPLEKDWIFPSQKFSAEPLSRFQAYRIIREAAEYAGLDKHVSCHSLRKTFGYHAWKQGIQPAMLMNIYNHSSFQITKRYLGIDQDDKDEVFMNIRL